VLNKNRTLDDIWQIPIRTYFSAMRVASKYGMEDIQIAITRVITHLPSPGIGQAIGRLAFMAEFPSHFSLSLAGDVFLQVCSLSSTPTVDDMKPLMAYPVLVTAMIKSREGTLRSQLRPRSLMRRCGVPACAKAPPPPRMGGWIQKELRSFGFTE